MIPCSTCNRVFISKKKNSPVSSSTRYSTVPADPYSIDSANSTAAFPSCSLSPSLPSTNGLGHSSTTF